MTTTLPPHTPGLRRTIPPDPPPRVLEHLRSLLGQREGWVRRPHWTPYLETGDDRYLSPVGDLTREQLVAVHAWLRQQRHAIHHALEGGLAAPDGWVESLPLYQVVRDGARLDA